MPSVCLSVMVCNSLMLPVAELLITSCEYRTKYVSSVRDSAHDSASSKGPGDDRSRTLWPEVLLWIHRVTWWEGESLTWTRKQSSCSRVPPNSHRVCDIQHRPTPCVLRYHPGRDQSPWAGSGFAILHLVQLHLGSSRDVKLRLSHWSDHQDWDVPHKHLETPRRQGGGAIESRLYWSSHLDHGGGAD